MSVQIQTVEFGRREAHLSELEGGPPYPIHGIALGAGDVTVGQSGIKKVWPADELQAAAETLEGTNLVKDHGKKSSDVVGTVTKAGYKEGVGVLYEAELYEEDLAKKVSNDLLEVSIRGSHIDVDEMEENGDGAKVVENIEFADLSIVPTGAAPSNTVDMGEHAELSAAELAEFTDTLESSDAGQGSGSSAALEPEVEPGMWVTDGDMHGITISAVQDGEIEVDVYEESDDKWRSTGETEMVSVDSLDEWDVDEEDVGAMEDEESDEEEDGSDEEENAVTTGDMPAEDYSKNNSGAPEWREGMLVRWQVEPQLFGKIVHVDDKRDIVMVEIHERMDGELTSTGFTISAGYSDITPLDDQTSSQSGHGDMEDEEEMAAERYDDYPEAASENAQMALDAREETDNPNDCGTDVGWKRANQLANNEGLTRDQVAKMSAFNRHRQNSDMSDEEGEADCGWMMWKAWGGDEGVDWASEKLDEIEEENGINLSGVAELQDYSMHTPDWSGTTEGEWSSPDMEDFDTDDMSEIDDHFLISMDGFPPEDYGDLKLPVVEPNGDLNVNALAAVKGGRGVSAVDGLSSEMEDDIVDWVNETANDEFDRNWGEDEEEAAHYMERPATVDDTGDEPGVEESDPVETSLDCINKYLRIEGKHERDSVDKMLSWLFSSVDLPLGTLEDFRTAATRFLDETPGTDSFDGLTVEQFRDWLLMHGDKSRGHREMKDQQRGELPTIATPVHVLTGDDLWQRDKSRESELDDTTRNITTMTEETIEDKLAELNEPVAVEQGDLEELRDKADRFDEMSESLESLKERTDILDEVDREQVEELAESDDPVVLESTRHEMLEGEAEQVKTVYAAALSEEMAAFSADELAERFSIEELREKYEDEIGDPEEELTAEPKSGDADEEELENRANDGGEEELSNEEQAAAEKREELREKILGGD
jgi:hypothetical protein